MTIQQIMMTAQDIDKHK